MISTAVWITSDEAKIFQFGAEGVTSHHMKAHGKSHNQAHLDAEKFYHEVAQYLMGTHSQRWLLMGPGLAKTHFQHHIETHHTAMKKFIFGNESFAHGTDGEMQNFAHEYFKKKGVFDNLNA